MSEHTTQPPRPAPPDVEFQSPPCPICGVSLDSDFDCLDCVECDATWRIDGTGGTWDEPDEPRCQATLAGYLGLPDWPEPVQCDRGAWHPAQDRWHASAALGEPWTDDDSGYWRVGVRGLTRAEAEAARDAARGESQ